MTETGRLSPEARADLLALARGTLEAHLRGSPPPRLASDRAETFGEPRGLFVSLHKGGELRGCIGTLAPTGDVTRVVSEFALRAAFEDPRFAPLAAEELSDCRVEISVLTAPDPVASPDQIEIGRHGLILELGPRRGLLLPQVATEWGFDAERFLDEVSRKAGLPPGAWRRPEAKLWTFQAEVFSE